MFPSPVLSPSPLVQIPTFEDLDQLGRPSDPFKRFYVPEENTGRQPPIYSRLGREVDPNPARRMFSVGNCRSHHHREPSCETRCAIRATTATT